MNILELKRKLLPMSGLQMDGGGGSSTGGGTQVQELPEWARPYAKSALEKGAALSEQKYQTYDQPRIAGFSPMQQQAQEGAANMQTSGATGAGIGIAGEAAMRGLGTQYQAGQFQNQFQAPQDYQAGRFRADRVGTQSFTQPGAAEDYMSPYMQNVVDVQQREAQRSSDIMGQQNAARAVGQGAFGGSRSALVEAERQRNLATQKGDIQAAGSQAAFNQAQQQFNTDQARRLQAQQANQQYGLQAQQLGEQSRQFGAGQGLQSASLGAQYGQAANQLGEQSRQYGAGLGIQGLQTALQGAGQLGALGGQEFQQGMDINKLQSAYGGQQQALRQQGLTQAYQDFQNEQNHPYKQLGFFSDLIRGLPVGQATTKTMYEPDPSMAQQIGSIGMGAYGLSKFMAEGGMAYADGGSVDSADNVQRIVSQLSDQQLQQSAQAAQARGDMDQLEAIQSELAMRASERRGIAGSVTPQMADRMAGGGVVAFATGGLNDYMKNIVDASTEDIADTPEQRLSGIKGALPGIQSLYGESAMKPFMEELKKDREGLGTQKNQGEGLAFLAGAEALVRPGSKSRAVTGALAAIGGGLAKANKDYTEANSKLRQAEMTLAASEQARADGQIGKAESLYDKGREDKKEAITRKMNANEKLATIQASVDNSIRSTSAQMASVNKPGETERMLADLDAIRTGKKEFQGLTGEEGAKAYQDSVGQLGAARYGVRYTGQNKDFEHRKAVLEVLQKDEGVKIAQMKVAQLEAKEKLTPKEQAALDANNAFLKKRYDSVSTDLQKSGGAAASAQAGGNKNVITMADIQRTAASSGKTVEEVRAAAAAKGYTIQ